MWRRLPPKGQFEDVEKMNKNWKSSIWVRVIVFLWMFVFPIIFIALPLLEMFGEERATSMTPVWALVVWMLAPAAIATGMKYLRGSRAPQNETDKAQ